MASLVGHIYWFKSTDYWAAGYTSIDSDRLRQGLDPFYQVNSKYNLFSIKIEEEEEEKSKISVIIYMTTKMQLKAIKLN